MTRKAVLLVEDDVDARVIYGTMLRHVGYRVIEAPTLMDARRVVRCLLPDAVVLDCRLPDGDGLDLVNGWRDALLGRIPVIVVSAHHDDRAACLAGADMFLAKPCPGDVLASQVARAITARPPSRRYRCG